MAAAPEGKREIYILDKYISLSPVRKFIDQSGFRPDEVMVMFDFDQTLTAKYGTTIDSTRIRGREKTLHMIQHLNKDDIRWYINTARGPGSPPAIAKLMKNLYKIPFSTSYILNTKGKPARCTETRQKDGTFDYTSKQSDGGGSFKYGEKEEEATIGICNNIISATGPEGGEFGYAKDLALNYILSIKAIQSTDLYKPKLIIFVDDDITNIQKIYNYMKEKQKDINFIGIIYEPWDHPEHPDDDITALAYLKGTGDLISEKITEEYSKEEDITAIDKVLEVIAKSNEDNLKVSQELSASIAKIANFISGAPSPGAAPPGAAAAAAAAANPPAANPPDAAAAAAAAGAAAAEAAAASAAAARPPGAAQLLGALVNTIQDDDIPKIILECIQENNIENPPTLDQIKKWYSTLTSESIRSLGITSISKRKGRDDFKKIIKPKITKEIVEEIKKIVAGGRRLRIRKTKKKNRKSNKTRSRQKRL